MGRRFTKNIARFVEFELQLAIQARGRGATAEEFKRLENAHVLGQESTYWHLRAHMLMLAWAVRNARAKEFFGQLFRIGGAATKTAVGLVPKGNTGGADVSPFRAMPLRPEFEAAINEAKAGV